MKRNRTILSLLLAVSLMAALCPGTVILGAEKAAPEAISFKGIEIRGKATGYQPVDYKPAKTWHPDQEAEILLDESLPSKYFPKEEITEIKDQATHNYCWAFATASAMEQSVVKRMGKKLKGDDLFYPEAFVSLMDHPRMDPLGLTEGDSYNDLYESELNNGLMLSQVVMNGFGPVDYKKSKEVSADALGFSDRAYRVKDTRWISSREAREIKKAIMKYGSVVFNIKSKPLFNYEFVSENGKLGISTNYYVYTPSPLFDNSDHTITLVGWDDDIPKERFDIYEDYKCPMDGGFIIKNSWGDKEIVIDGKTADSYREAIGLTTDSQPVSYFTTDEGYDYLSYADHSLWWDNGIAIAYDMRDAAPEENIYYYDGGISIENVACQAAATRFKAKANKGGGEKIKSAIIGVDSPGEYCVDLCLYPEENASDAEERPWEQECVAEVHNFIAENTGLYTVDFPKPVTVNEGESFAIVVHREDGSPFRIMVDRSVNYDWIGSINHTELGESYIIDEYGNDLNQYDIKGITPRIKAITVNTGKVERNFSITAAKGTTVIVGDICSISMDNIDPAKVISKGKAGEYDPETGLLTTLKKGTVKLLYPVEKNGKTKMKPFCSVKVLSPKLKESQKIKAGKSKKLKLSGIKNPEAVWVSSDPETVTVDEKTGEIKGIKAGEAMVAASLKGYPKDHIYFTIVTVQ